MAATLAASVGFANPPILKPTLKVTIPVDRITPTNGQQMYVNYCATCHGIDGRGHGPVAIQLKTPPTDLTALSRNNRGKFPDSHIATVLQSGVELTAHGTAAMPVWGPIFGRMNQANPQERLLRISNLSRYLQTLQAK
jgi:mono/diheme cytochrome c family protein